MSQTNTGASGQLHPYIQTLRAHRLLFALPVVVAAVMAIWFVFGAPKQYESVTSLWIDTAPSTDVTPAQPTDASGAVIPPAAQAQTLLNELLSTRHFRTQVGHESPLANYLAHHTSKGWSPTALMASLRGTPSLENRVVDALGAKGVTTKVVGPQLLAITLRSADPTVAASTLKVLLTEFDKEAQSTRAARGQAAVAYYKDQVAGAQERLTAAHAQVDAYLAEHPGVKPCASPSSGASSTSTSSGCADLRLRALTDADRAAAARLVDATGNLNQASINLQALPAAGSTFRVVDPPRVPVGPVAGLKKAVLGVFAGIFAGLLASALGVAGVTGLQRAVRPADVGAEEAPPTDAPAAVETTRPPIQIEVFGGEDAPPPPAAEAKAAAAKAAESKAAEAKAAEAKAADAKAAEAKAAEAKAAEAKAAEAKAAEAKAAEAKAAEAKAAEAKAAEAKAAEAKAAEAKAAEAKVAEAKAAEAKAAEAKAAEAKAAEAKAAEAKAAEAKAAEAKAAEAKAAEAKAAEAKAAPAAPPAKGTTRVAATVGDAETAEAAEKPRLSVGGGDGRTAADELAWEAGPPPPPGAESLAPVPARTNGGASTGNGTPPTPAESPDVRETARPAGRRARRAPSTSSNGDGTGGESDDAGPPATEPAARHAAPATRTGEKAATGAARGRRAYTGTVIRVRVDGAGPKAHAVWSIRQPLEQSQPTPGSRIHVERPPGYGGLVRALRDHDGAHIFEVEITAAKPSPGTPDEQAIPATDPRWLGTEVSFAPGSATSARTPARRRSPSPL